MAAKIRKRGDFGPGTYFLAAPVKGRQRAEAKTRVKYLNDASQLTDTVRGTLVLDLPEFAVENPEVVCQNTYDVLKSMLKTFSFQGAFATHFDDRYQKPLGDYRDWLFLFKVQGYI